MFIAKNNDVIILANNSKEELQKQLQFMVYTSIEETKTEYVLYNGSYIIQKEVQIKHIQQRITELTGKIDELQQMVLPEIINGCSQNVALYKDIISGLQKAKQDLIDELNS